MDQSSSAPELSAAATGELELAGRRVLVTGGSGFIGSHIIRALLDGGVAGVLNLDSHTYAADESRLGAAVEDPRYRLVRVDVADHRAVHPMVIDYRPYIVIHCAGESEVTRSEFDSNLFHHTNVEGTRTMLRAAESAGAARFVQLSTDKVYGSVENGVSFEGDRTPGIPLGLNEYTESKAVADDLVATYQGDLEWQVLRPANVFGPWQFPEKSFPRWTVRALRRETIPVWGDGGYIRQWLYIDDLVQAVLLLIRRGALRAVYNVGPHLVPELTNLEMAALVARNAGAPEDLVRGTEYDRPKHDRRYRVDSSRLFQLGWKTGDLLEQVTRTVEWYHENQAWWYGHLEVAESIFSDIEPVRAVTPRKG
ncbi:NAD-dependent epimerase/dehydratase family protein [Nocardia beijingensis]|uniref:dTDP-glucose 4,6-dehydratase n=1 Tax=Nocardia beijingensis TaxID=95162 RepID=UPI00344B9065